MRTWLIVAAEDRELSGIRKRCGGNVKDGRSRNEIEWRGERWLLVANGPGPELVSEVLQERKNVDGIVSTGFCGALDPALRVGDIVVADASGLADASVTSPLAFVRGPVLTLDRVAVTAGEKRALRTRTGALAVEMEACTVEAKAREWGVPFRCVKVVSDTAHQDLPLDFNLYRDAAGRFSRGRIARAAVARPFSRVPALLRLDRDCRAAAEKLGEFFANCTF
jgi:adenosylhomocysteine nucleosidase